MSVVRAVVLGAGRVGSLIARDLAHEPGWRVVALDRDGEALRGLADTVDVEPRRVDLGDVTAIRAAIAPADVVVGAVPGAIGFSTLRAVIDAGKPVVDVSFSPEDPLVLDELARSRGVPAVVDCGVAPGLSNWLVGRSAAELERVESVDILVGGLPVRRVWPFEYRAVFSPTDVIEEYLRPCRLRENGVLRTVPALSGVERVDFPRVGTLEAFYTDGLRTLLRSVDAPTLREKTLRYPGHAERMQALRETGFLDANPRRVGDVEVAPRALTERLLFEAWALAEGEAEFTVLRVVVEGEIARRRTRRIWDLYDRTDEATGTTSMARTTGFPCALVARLVAAGRWSRPGVSPPERLGREPELTAHLLQGLRARGVEIESRTESG